MTYSVYISRPEGQGDYGSGWELVFRTPYKNFAYAERNHLENVGETVRIFRGNSIGRLIYESRQEEGIGGMVRLSTPGAAHPEQRGKGGKS